jgi:hypothetical protein
MKRKLLASLVITFFVMVLPFGLMAEDNRRDGNWWRGQDRLIRSAYIVGFFDGMDLGYNFSYWKFIQKKEMNSCIIQMHESYSEYSDKYFKNVSNSQLVDGLDSFYVDFRNRSIRVADAVWSVVNSIAGTPQEELDSMIENWRRNANH